MPEYNNTSVSGACCSYRSLNSYNQGMQGLRPPVPASTVSGMYIVPTYSAPGYNTLMHGQKSAGCSGYFGIQGAYGTNADKCGTKYVQKLCQ